MQIIKDIKEELKDIHTDSVLEDKRIKCIFCKKPIHIDNFAGITKEGYICGDSFCLMELAKEIKHDEQEVNKE